GSRMVGIRRRACGGTGVGLGEFEYLMSSTSALRIDKDVHSARGARSVRGALRSLPMEPHVRQIKGKQQRSEQESRQSQNVEQHGLARFSQAMRSAFEFPVGGSHE